MKASHVIGCCFVVFQSQPPSIPWFLMSTPNPLLNRTPAGGLTPARRLPVRLLR
jgi:hypothetical protein